MRRMLTICCGALWSLTAVAEEAQTVRWIKGSTTPLVQLTGEKFQYQGTTYHQSDTHNRTLTHCGLNGADLGVPVSFPDKIVLLFGDSWGHTQDAAGKFVWHSGWGKADSIAYFDRPFEPEKACAIEEFENALRAGKQPQIAELAAPQLKFYLKPKPLPGQPLFYETAIKNLAPGQALGPFEVPTGAFALNERLYVFYNVKHQESHDGKGKRKTFFLNSILARSDETYQHWRDDAPPTLTRLYDVSEHPKVDDANNPPSDENGPGKFIHVAPVVLERAVLEKLKLSAALPPALRAARKVILLWGASWHYVHSNLYLAAVSADEIEATVNGERDVSKWWYLKSLENGAPQWSNDESAAVPLLDNWGQGPCIGEHSVVWSPALEQFVLAYQDHYIQIKFRMADTPWGPWSKEMHVFGIQDEWSRKLSHRPGKDQIVPQPVPVFKPNGEPFKSPENHGATYGPYLFEHTTQNADGSVTLYFTMSTWNPYQVFLMKTRFARGQ